MGMDAGQIGRVGCSEARPPCPEVPGPRLPFPVFQPLALMHPLALG